MGSTKSSLCSTYNIRQYCSEDKKQVAQIYLTCRQETFDWRPTSEFLLEDFDKDTEGEVILVAELNGAPVGFISTWVQDDFIHNLFVAPSYQSEGIGELLLQEALKLIQRPARLKCVVQNTKACRFYEKHGWEIESTTNDDPMEPYHTYVKV